jgi:hypothetical protein
MGWTKRICNKFGPKTGSVGDISAKNNPLQQLTLSKVYKA